jgi:hypothetical protein
MDPVAATLQISLAPSDLPHARVVLPHQLRTWAGQAEEVLLTVDGLRGASHGRFAEGWEERRPGLDALLAEAATSHPNVRVAEVDYAPATRAAVAERFFGGQAVPEKDARGGPFYAYFFALSEARHDVVMHLDSDMLFGGGSQRWLGEASELLAARADALAVNPLGGPPTEDPARWRDPREPLPYLGFRCDSISSRICLLDRRRLAPLEVRPAARLRSRVKARVHGHPDAALPEDLLTAAMHARGMVRLDVLGSAPGMWSVHPPFRSERFYAELPALVERVERGDVPDEQRGEFDVADALFDWTEARAAFRRRRWLS